MGVMREPRKPLEICRQGTSETLGRAKRAVQWQWELLVCMGGGKNPLAGRARGTKDPPPGAETPHPGQHEATASQLVSGLCLLHRSRGDPHHGGDQPQHPLLGHGDPGRRQTPTHPPLPANASPPDHRFGG